VKGFKDMTTLIRRFTTPFLLSLALLSLTGATLTATAQAAEPLIYCKEDAARLCGGVPPGGGRIIACLKYQKMALSVGCAMELKAMKARMGL
jgi:hypothetical protein